MPPTRSNNCESGAGVVAGVVAGTVGGEPNHVNLNPASGLRALA